MTTVLEFNEKKFWITLFSIMARREAARESSPGRIERYGGRRRYSLARRIGEFERNPGEPAAIRQPPDGVGMSTFREKQAGPRRGPLAQT
jgi:hypothetical protein